MTLSTLLRAATAQRWGDDHMSGWGWGMMAFVLLLGVALIAVIVTFVARDSGRRTNRSGTDPVDVLDHRFARGEIDEEEYRKRRDVLRG